MAWELEIAAASPTGPVCRRAGGRTPPWEPLETDPASPGTCDQSPQSRETEM